MAWSWKSWRAVSFLRRITDKPQEDLLQYVQSNNIDEIERLLLLYPELKTHRYYYFNEKTILHIACCDYADYITHITVSFLIKLGCDLDYADDYGYRALHYAAVGQNVKVLEVILQESKNPSSLTMSGDTALHLLIDTGFRNNREDFLECIDLLRQKIDMNVLDNIFESAIYKAATKDDQEVVELLLNCDGIQIDVEIKIEQLNWHKKKARDHIKDASIVRVDEDMVRLCSLIDQRDETQFLKLLLELNKDKYHNLIPYFVKKACYENQKEIIKYFTCIKRTPDMIARFSMRTPFRVAVMDGLHEVIGYILDHSQNRDEMDVEVELLQRKKQNNSINDYEKCLEIYLQKCPNMLDPNHQRTKGNYILQRCIKFGHNEATLYLLKHGASLANNDVSGNITMTGISFSILKEYLDSCISLEFEGLKRKVVFNYQSFLPTDATSIPLDLESGSRNMQLKPEMKALLYMTKSLELKSLLNHPLITSYVYLKWHKVKWIYYTNLILYVLFACIVILYLVPFYLSEKRTSPGFALVFLVLIIDTVLFLKELFQIVVFRSSYLRHFENYIELSLAFSVAALIGYYFSNSPPPDELKACVILLLGFGFLFLLGSHPEFSTTIAMFRTVSYEYVKFLLFYVTIIICFAISFYTIFRNDSKNVLFKNPLAAVFKTFIMITGEYEAGELDFHEHTFLTYIIYTAFVFSNAIVLLNLLNSLAVSDVQNIINKAELFSSEATIKYIGVIESLVFKEFQNFGCLNIITKYVIVPFADIISLYPNDIKDYKFTTDRNFEEMHYKGKLDIAIVHRAVTIAEEKLSHNENIKTAISFLRRITDKPQEDLLEYVLTNNLDEIERLLLLYPELKTHRYYDYNEKTILHIACCDYADDITHITVSFLIELGCDLDYDDDYGFRALHYAVVGQNVDVLELILQESENPSSFTMGGDTALHLLIDTGPRNNRGDFLKCIDLLRQKIDINVLNNLFESAIYKAVKKDDQEVVELLLNCDGIQIDVEINIKQLNWHKTKARYLIKDASRVKIDEDVVELCSLIDQRDETQFLYLLLKLNEKKYYNLVPYFIKKACYEKKLEIIKYFTSIERTPDMVARFSMRTPLRVAVMDGLHEVMGYILDISKSRDEMDVEVELMQRKKRNSSIKNYDKCLDIYLKKCPNMLDPNHERTKGNYILQRCIKFNQHEAVLYLLKHGASLANNDEQGNITMEGIPFDILEEHFDSCINIESKGFTEKVVFDYKSFMPTDGPSIQLDLESGSRNMQLKPEMNALLYMTESLELKTLLKHPLIMSYVYLQWDRVKWFHHINLIVYVFFASTIILCLRPFDLSQKLPNPDIALVLLLLFFDIVFFMKEVFQIFVFRLNYFKYFENYIELSLALSVAALIDYYFSNSPPPDELKACVILLLGFGFLFLLGSHPKLSTTIAMFRKVSYEYVQFLIFYITIIISFAISFYTIFRNDSAEVSFTNPLTAVFKTFIMMTGEYEAGELDFQVHTFLTYIIYATFVFSNGIVLLNLLNSLAISDVQKIKNEAELWSLKATIKYIGAIESLVFNEFQSNSYRNLIMQYVGKLYLKNKPDYELLIGRKIEKRHYGGILDIAIVHEAVEIAKKRQRQNENINVTS